MMAQQSGSSLEPSGRAMKRERELPVRREDEPAFEDADVDHHDPQQRRRRQQQQQSRDDIIIVVSDSDTEDEADATQDVTPSSAPATAFAVRPSAVNSENGHKFVAVDRSAAAAVHPPAVPSATPSTYDDMPPLIPPPLPQQRPPAAFILLPSAPSAQPLRPLSSDLPHHTAQQHAFISAVQLAVLPHQHPSILNDYTAQPKGGWPGGPSFSPVPVPPPASAPRAVDGIAPLSFLQSLLGHIVTKPFASYCFACQRALSLSTLVRCGQLVLLSHMPHALPLALCTELPAPRVHRM